MTATLPNPRGAGHRTATRQNNGALDPMRLDLGAVPVRRRLVYPETVPSGHLCRGPTPRDRSLDGPVRVVATRGGLRSGMAIHIIYHEYQPQHAEANKECNSWRIDEIWASRVWSYRSVAGRCS